MGDIKGEIYGYKVVEDDDVEELRLPSEIIKVLKKSDTFKKLKKDKPVIGSRKIYYPA